MCQTHGAIVLHTLAAVRERVGAGGTFAYNSWQLLGYDFLIDADRRVSLLEVHSHAAVSTRMTEAVFADMMAKPDQGFDRMDPANISPLVVFLASAESAFVNGRVFEVEGGMIALADGWRRGATIDQDQRWNPEQIAGAVERLIAEQPASEPVYGT